MTTHLLVLGNRARSTTAIAILALVPGLITAPTAACAASGHPTSVLADGVASDQTRPAPRLARLADRSTQLHTHKHEAKAASDPRPSAPQRSGAPVTAGRDASRFLTPPSKNRFGPVAIGAALATLITAPLALLLGLERRRRYRAASAESFLRAALATAVTEAARLRQPPDRTVHLVDQVDTAAPVPMGAAEPGVASGTIEARGERSGPKLPAIDGPPRPRTVHLADQADAAAPGSVGTTELQRSPARVSAAKRVIGYVTVSADPVSREAGTSSDAIEAACERSGWKLLEIVRDRENGRILERPGLHYALERIANGKARGLVVGELQRLSRSIVDLGALMAWFRDTQATLIALDLRIDTSTPEGYHVATTLIALSNWEHERIANRTRSGLAEVRAHGHPTGRPAVSDRPDLLQRIWAMRAANMTLQAIADQLNAEHTPTLRGGRKWRPSSIQAALGYRRPGPRDHLPSPPKRGPLSPARSTTPAPAPTAAAASRTQPGRRGNASKPDAPSNEG